MSNPDTPVDSMMSLAGDELRADTLMPAQFYPARRGSAAIEPITRLMGGILADALRCLQRNFEANSPGRRREFREARFWIFQSHGNGPFSFEEVCDALAIDPHRLRTLIVQWEKDRRPGVKPRMIRRSPVNIGRVRAGRKSGMSAQPTSPGL
jgi:hypothetical protein